MGEAFTIWLHLFAVAVWIGPQVFMFVGALPATREVLDEGVRLRVLRVLTTRFGYLGWGAMVVIVMTGISNVFQVSDEFDGVFDPDFRYMYIFTAKMIVLAVALTFTAMHTFDVGPAQLRLMEAGGDPAEVARLRRLSVVSSSLGLLGSLGVLFAGALLANHDYSFQSF